jgi:hypothetical protein
MRQYIGDRPAGPEKKELETYAFAAKVETGGGSIGPVLKLERSSDGML